MWQLTEVLSVFPDWLWGISLLTGIALYFLSDSAAAYRISLKVSSIVLLIVSVWMLGALSNDDIWAAKVKDLEEKVAVAEEQAKKENVIIEERIVYRDRVINARAKTQIEYIDRIITQREEVKVYIEHCPVPDVIIEEHNRAARGEFR